MVSLSDFLRGVGLNAHRVTKYEWGADGSKVTGQREEARYENGQKVTYIIEERPCDCIGLIVGALELAGGKWPGNRGANWTARNAMDGLRAISSADQLSLGEIVFKAREPGESGYDLPKDYAASPDRRDYYHVGVVTQVSPLEITHCTSVNGTVNGGIKRDNAIGQWAFGGKLKLVSYPDQEEKGQEAEGDKAPAPVYQALVTAPTGSTVNLRGKPSLNSAVLFQVPIGETVDVLEDGMENWSRIFFQGQKGYMMKKYLQGIPLEEKNLDLPALLRVRSSLLSICAELERIVQGGAAL